MATIFSKAFWKEATDRAAKSAGHVVVLALIGEKTNVLTLDLQVFGGAVLTGVVLSYATSIVSSPFGDQGTASIIPSGDART